MEVPQQNQREPLKKALHKEERLHEKALIEQIFQKGSVIHLSPIKLLWLAGNGNEKVPVKVAFSAPKRVFKSAVTRNLLKRRMREAYRKNKIFKPGSGTTYALLFIYTGREIKPSSEIESKIVLTLQQLKTFVSAD